VKSNNMLAVILLGLVSLGHLVRVIFSINVVVGSTVLPIYVSIIAFFLFGYAAYSICDIKK